MIDRTITHFNDFTEYLHTTKEADTKQRERRVLEIYLSKYGSNNFLISYTTGPKTACVATPSHKNISEIVIVQPF